jgi:hypothetical protein
MRGYSLDRVAENALYAAVMPAPMETTLIAPSPSYVVQRCASPGDAGIPPLAQDPRVERRRMRAEL